VHQLSSTAFHQVLRTVLSMYASLPLAQLARHPRPKVVRHIPLLHVLSDVLQILVRVFDVVVVHRQKHFLVQTLDASADFPQAPVVVLLPRVMVVLEVVQLA